MGNEDKPFAVARSNPPSHAMHVNLPLPRPTALQTLSFMPNAPRNLSSSFWLPISKCLRARTTMASISLDSQTFFDPHSAAGGKPTSQNRSPRNGGLSVASLRGKKELQQDIHNNQADIILISSDSESDYGGFDDCQSDTSFPPIDKLLPPARHSVESSNVTGIRL